MKNFVSISLLAFFWLVHFSAVESAKKVDELKESFRKKRDLLLEHLSMVEPNLTPANTNPTTRQIKGLEIQQLSNRELIVSIFERYSSFTLQVCFLACRARYKLVSDYELENSNIYDNCLQYSKFTHWYNSQPTVKMFYGSELTVKGNNEAAFKITTVVENIKILFTKLAKMEKVFDLAEKNGYESLLEKLNEIEDVNELIEIISIKNTRIMGEKLTSTQAKDDAEGQQETPVENDENDTSASFFKHFFKFFGAPFLYVENYWQRFFEDDDQEITDYSQLVNDKKIANARLQFARDVTGATKFDGTTLEPQNIKDFIYAELAYYSKILNDKKDIPPEMEIRRWYMINPTNRKIDFQYKVRPNEMKNSSKNDRGHRAKYKRGGVALPNKHRQPAGKKVSTASNENTVDTKNGGS